MITIENINKTYNNRKVLNNISIEFKENCLSVIIGTSGSGKTTLLNIISGYLRSDEGYKIYLKENHKLIYNLVDDININILSVLDNMKLVCKDIKKIDAFLKRLNIIHLRSKKLSSLSKGEQARVSIARVLVSNANIILLDEPTGNLDIETSEIVFKILKEESKNRTIILVTHDMQYASKYADNLYELKNGQIDVLKENIKKNSILQTISTHHISNKLLFKYSFKKIFSNKIFMFINILLIACSFTALSVANAFNNIDMIETTKLIISDLKTNVFSVNDLLHDNKKISEKEYMRDNEIAQNIELYSSKYQENFINAIFYEDAKDYIHLDKDIFSYSLSKNDSEYEKYYPIILTNQIRRFFSTKYKTVYSIGDTFDYSYQYNNIFCKINFVIVDFIEAEYEALGFYDFYPVIIPKKSYYDMIEINGIYDSSLNFLDYATEYNDSCTTNFKDRISQISNQFVNISFFNDDIKPYDELISKTGLYYIGRIPTKPNEVMITSIDDYWKYTGDISNKFENQPNELSEQQKSFLKKYEDGYPVKMFSISSNQADNQNLKIVGAIGYMDNGVNMNLKSYTIISNILYDSLYNKINNENLMIYSGTNKYYFSKNELLNRINDFYNGNLIVNYEDLKTYSDFKEIKGFSQFTFYFSLIIFGICSFTSLIYINNIFKDMKKDLAVMQLNGSQKKDKVKIILFQIIIQIVPIFIMIPFALIFINLLGKWYAGTYGFIVSISFRIGSSYLSLIAFLLIYILIIAIPVVKLRKNQVLDVIKNE